MPAVRDLSPFDAKDDLSGVFGMTEMERAAAKIIAAARQSGSWRSSFSAWGFQKDDYEFIGFVNLLAFGWIRLAHSESEWEFKVTKAFIKKVTPCATSQS